MNSTQRSTHEISARTPAYSSSWSPLLQAPFLHQEPLSTHNLDGQPHARPLLFPARRPSVATSATTASDITVASSATSTPIIFYDIAQRPPVAETCCTPNPWKSRLALNFKAVPYTTTWVKMPDISSVRSGLNVPACRKFADGSDYNTLPIIHDPATGSLVGDSFDIAAYLQRTYPNSGAGDLFPPQKLDYAVSWDMMQPIIPLSEIRAPPELADYARFNTNVDAAFTAHVGLMIHGIPLDPATADVTKAEFVRRAGLSSWDDLGMVGEARDEMMQSLRNTLGELAALFRRDASGPFLLRQRATYADMIIGGWLRMMRATLPASEWQEVRACHGAIFGQLHDALDKYAEVK